MSVSQTALCRALLAVVLLPWAALPAGADSSDWPLAPHLGRGRIGVRVQPMTAELREHMKVPADRGLLVTRVEADRPAARSGVQVGDVLVTADGAPLESPWDLVRTVARVPQGKTLELGVVREGKPRTLRVSPEGEPQPWVDPEQWGEWLERGMRHGSRELRRQLEELQRRLEELERRFDEHQRLGPDGVQETRAEGGDVR